MDSTAIGKQTERLACRYLQNNGLTHQTSNYRCGRGEIDLVMYDGDTIVFVEVRYRQSNAFGSGAESIDRRKQHRLLLCAQYYLNEHGKQHANSRFDVISMQGPLKQIRIDWIVNAFGA